MVETAFKAGIRAYASCLSATAGPIFDLRAGLDGLEDEDMISPTTVFQGMPTWDAVMAQPVAQIAQQQGKGIMDTFLDMALADELRTSFQVIDRNNDPEAQRQILGSPYTVIGTTDGGARPDKRDRTDYSTRLLSYWVREKQIMSLEEAVYRMTGKTALMHALHDRGFIAPGGEHTGALPGQTLRGPLYRGARG